MNPTYIVGGAVAGLVTGWGSALMALRAARSQEVSARELQRRQWDADRESQRRQWRADTLRSCYSEVGGTHRRFMTAWLYWWEVSDDGRTREQYAELAQAGAAFGAATTAVRIYAPQEVVDSLNKLKELTNKFDLYAKEHRYDKKWQPSDQDEYERMFDEVDCAMGDFVEAARKSIDGVLKGIIS